VNYIVNNNLGVIDNAHLAWADQLKDGVRHGKCLKLAELHSLAVDFPKTGVPAKMDRRLRPRSYPHFMEKVDKASYHSESVLGKIYDRITEFEFTPDTDARLNEALLVDGHELYHDEARRVKREYDEAVLSVMNQFGIATEWEAVSGWIVQFNTLLSKRDFHLREQVMELMGGIIRNFRKRFEEEFIHPANEPPAPVDLEDAPRGVNVRLEDLAKRTQIVDTPQPYKPGARAWTQEDIEAMRRKASAWYFVTYDKDERELSEGHSNMLSFPWVVYDHLCDIARERREAGYAQDFAARLAAEGMTTDTFTW
jgi:hypothetical protein